MDYSEPGINDPVMRCNGCSKLVHRVFIHKHGKCSHCGNMRFRQVSTFTEQETIKIREGKYNFEIGEYTIDPEFLAQFEEIGEIVGGSDG